MDFAIVASKKDEAGMNIIEEFEKISSLPIYLTEKEIIYAENIDREVKEDFIIFASKHQGKKEKMLSIHAPGNWGVAEMGGENKKICKTSALFLKHLFQVLNEETENLEGWQTTLEVTHHGPYVEKPCCFIEIGSCLKQWRDKKAGKIIAETIKKAIETFDKEKLEKKWGVAIGVGGPHYCPNFNKIQLKSEIALSHIIPQYAFPIREGMLKEAINKTEESVNFALIDWKGLKSEERKETINLLKEIGLDYKKTSEISK